MPPRVLAKVLELAGRGYIPKSDRTSKSYTLAELKQISQTAFLAKKADMRSIHSLNLSPCVVSGLENRKIETLSGLCEFGRRRLMSIHCIGKLRVSEIETRLQSRGFRLAD